MPNDCRCSIEPRPLASRRCPHLEPLALAVKPLATSAGVIWTREVRACPQDTSCTGRSFGRLGGQCRANVLPEAAFREGRQLRGQRGGRLDGTAEAGGSCEPPSSAVCRVDLRVAAVGSGAPSRAARRRAGGGFAAGSRLRDCTRASIPPAGDSSPSGGSGRTCDRGSGHTRPSGPIGCCSGSRWCRARPGVPLEGPISAPFRSW